MVITSLMFIKTAKMEEVTELMEKEGIKVIYLEKLAKEVGLWDKINAYLRYKMKRVPHKHGGNRKAVILFTSGSEGAPKASRVLELNASHPVFEKLKAAEESGDKEKLGLYTNLLYDQALLVEGVMPEDPVAFASKVCELM